MMSKPKVLVFIDWFVPGYKAGGPIRSCLNMMNHLDNDFDFDVVCSDRDYLEEKPYDQVTYGDWNILEDNIRVRYLRPEEQNGVLVKQIISNENYQAVHINGIYSRLFSILPLKVAGKMDVPIIVSARGMLKESAIAVKKTKKTLFLGLSKLLGLYKNVTFHATNREEAEDIARRISPKAKVIIAPNLPKAKLKEGLDLPDKRVGDLKLVSLARVAPEKNLLFAIEVLQKVDPTINVTFDIYGAKYNKEYWQKCTQEVDQLESNVKVNYKGVLHPDEVEETISNYHALFLPTRGENFGHVILESLSVGTPVIISDQTPWKGLGDLKVGLDIPLQKKERFVQSFLTRIA